jgi:hypothetical protein
MGLGVFFSHIQKKAMEQVFSDHCEGVSDTQTIWGKEKQALFFQQREDIKAGVDILEASVVITVLILLIGFFSKATAVVLVIAAICLAFTYWKILRSSQSHNHRLTKILRSLRVRYRSASPGMPVLLMRTLNAQTRLATMREMLTMIVLGLGLVLIGNAVARMNGEEIPLVVALVVVLSLRRILASARQLARGVTRICRSFE